MASEQRCLFTGLPAGHPHACRDCTPCEQSREQSHQKGKRVGAVLIIVGLILAGVGAYFQDAGQPLIVGLLAVGAVISWMAGFLAATLHAPDLGNF